MTHVDAQHMPSPLPQCLKIAERLRPDEIAERIPCGRHGQILERLIDKLEEKAGVGPTFM
jgi:hypothetical protein